MFLVNSCLGLFSVTCSRRHPFSLSYGVILQSSLTMILSLVLGFSPRPPVSVCGTGTSIYLATFLASVNSSASLLVFTPRHHPAFQSAYFTTLQPHDLATAFHLRVQTILLCHCIIIYLGGTGISTCCPSATAFALALVPDLPWADKPSPGNLRLSTAGVLTQLSLLMPAFSLVYRPPLLPLWLLPVYIAPLPIRYPRIPKLRCQV